MRITKERVKCMKIMLDEGEVMPTRAHTYDAGLDLYAPIECRIHGSH